MSDDQMEIVVFGDQAGNFYALPRQTLDQWRIPDEARAVAEQRMGEADVAGHMGPELSSRGSFKVSADFTPTAPQAW